MNTKNILALDIGGSKMLAALVEIGEFPEGDRATDAKHGTLRFRVRDKIKTPLSGNCTKEALFHEIRAMLERIADVRQCDAVGVNVPGLADPKRGIWIFAPFSGIRDVPIVRYLREIFGPKPIAIENDVNACALAEKLFGVCTDVDDFLWITVSNGIGGGLVLGGEIYRGHFGHAGEIGHFHVVDDGRLCGCGNRGCLEIEAAGPAIARRYAKLKKEDANRKGSDFEPGNSCGNETTAEIAMLARNGDPAAGKAFEESGKLIGKAVSYAANLINPAKIVIGGGVSGAFDLLYPSLSSSFREHLFRSANSDIGIEKTALGYEAALIGAASVGYRRLQSETFRTA